MESQEVFTVFLKRLYNMTASQVGDESVDGWAMLMLLADKCVVYFDQLLGAVGFRYCHSDLQLMSPK